MAGVIATAIITAIASYLLGRSSTVPSSNLTFPDDANSWDLFLHLGGCGPYISKKYNTVDIDTLPQDCKIDQVHMLARHSERLPTLSAGARIFDLEKRLDRARDHFNGTLAFINDRSSFVEQNEKDFEQLTRTGPYAGTKTAFDLGVRIRTRYRQLHDQAVTDGVHNTFWASGSQRVIETAQYFATAFFGLDWTRTATLQIIPEGAELGANTLTPGETCLAYESESSENGWNLGATKLDEFRGPYLDAIRDRLLRENPNFEFHPDEIYVMQELCAFQTMAEGSSPWCDVFSHDEWYNYEYARDVLHYYRSGPGNPYAATMGWLWLNATSDLIQAGPNMGSFFFSFVHDGDIYPMLAALDLFPQPVHLPTTHVQHNRTWRTSDTVPMGANIIFERVTCHATEECWTSSPMYPNHVYCAPPVRETSIRIRINDRVVALPGCATGIGHSCPLSEFVERIQQRGIDLIDFRTLCGLPENSPQQIDFLHQ